MEIANFKITPIQKLIFNSLKSKEHYWKGKGKLGACGEFFCTDKDIMKDIGIWNKGTIKNGIKRLSNLGLISCDRGKWNGIASVYRIHSKGIKNIPFIGSERGQKLKEKGMDFNNEGVKNYPPRFIKDNFNNNEEVLDNFEVVKGKLTVMKLEFIRAFSTNPNELLKKLEEEGCSPSETIVALNVLRDRGNQCCFLQ